MVPILQEDDIIVHPQTCSKKHKDVQLSACPTQCRKYMSVIHACYCMDLSCHVCHSVCVSHAVFVCCACHAVPVSCRLSCCACRAVPAVLQVSCCCSCCTSALCLPYCACCAVLVMPCLLSCIYHAVSDELCLACCILTLVSQQCCSPPRLCNTSKRTMSE